MELRKYKQKKKKQKKKKRRKKRNDYKVTIWIKKLIGDNVSFKIYIWNGLVYLFNFSTCPSSYFCWFHAYAVIFFFNILLHNYSPWMEDKNILILFFCNIFKNERDLTNLPTEILS